MSKEPQVGDIWSNRYYMPRVGDVTCYYLLLEVIDPRFNFFTVLKLDDGHKCTHQVGLSFWRYEA